MSGQRVEAFPAKGVDAEQRRLWPVIPQAATNALALQRRDIAATVAGNISKCTGHRKEDLEQIAMLDIIQAARRYSQERGSLWPYARTYVNGKISLPAGQEVLDQGAIELEGALCAGAEVDEAGFYCQEIPERLPEYQRRAVAGDCSKRVVAWGALKDVE